MTEKCDCEDWIPDGYLCGKPGCPRTVKFEDSLRELGKALAEKSDLDSKTKSPPYVATS
jgi:hypothetical protein